MESLKQCERSIREAVIDESFERVTAAVEEYRRAFDLAWQSLPLAERRRSALPQEASDLMRWALTLLKTTRESLAGRRRASGAAGRYLEAGRGKRTATWGVAG